MSRPSALVALLFASALLSGCQSASAPGQGAVEQLAMENAMRTDRPRTMSDAERDRVLADAECAQNVAPAVGAANMLGGLDPTGLTQSAAQGAAMRCAAKVQAHMPALIEDNRARVQALCRAEPKRNECVEIARLEAQMRAMVQR